MMIRMLKKLKEQKKIVIKRIQSFMIIKTVKNEIILKSQQSKVHFVYTEEVNKVALSSNNDKILQTFDRIRTTMSNKCF